MTIQSLHTTLDTLLGLVPAESMKQGKSDGFDFPALLGLFMQGDITAAPGDTKAPGVVVRFSDGADTELSSGDTAYTLQAQLVVRTPDGQEVSLPVTISIPMNGNDGSGSRGTGIETGDTIVIIPESAYSPEVEQLLGSLIQSLKPNMSVHDKQAAPETGILADGSFSTGRTLKVQEQSQRKGSGTDAGQVIAGMTGIPVPDGNITRTAEMGIAPPLSETENAVAPLVISVSEVGTEGARDRTTPRSMELHINDIPIALQREIAGNGMTTIQDGAPYREVTSENLGKNIQSIKDTPQTTLLLSTFDSVPQQTTNQPTILFRTVSGTTPLIVGTGETAPSESRLTALIDALVSTGAQVEIVLGGENDIRSTGSTVVNDIPMTVNAGMLREGTDEKTPLTIDKIPETEESTVSHGIFGGRIRQISAQKINAAVQPAKTPDTDSVNTGIENSETRTTMSNNDTSALSSSQADNGAYRPDKDVSGIMRHSGGPGTVSSSTSNKNTPLNNPSNPPDAVFNNLFINQDQEETPVLGGQSDVSDMRFLETAPEMKNTGSSLGKAVPEASVENISEAGTTSKIPFIVSYSGIVKTSEQMKESGSGEQSLRSDVSAAELESGTIIEPVGSGTVGTETEIRKNPEIVFEHGTADPERTTFSRSSAGDYIEFHSTERTSVSTVSMTSETIPSPSNSAAGTGAVTPNDSVPLADDVLNQGIRIVREQPVSSASDSQPKSVVSSESEVSSPVIPQQNTEIPSQDFSRVTVAITDESATMPDTDVTPVTDSRNTALTGTSGIDARIRTNLRMNEPSPSVNGDASRDYSTIHQADLPDDAAAVTAETVDSGTVQNRLISPDTGDTDIQVRYKGHNVHSEPSNTMSRKTIHESTPPTDNTQPSGKETVIHDTSAVKKDTSIPEQAQSLVQSFGRPVHTNQVSKEERIDAGSPSGKTMPTTDKTNLAFNGSNSQFTQDFTGRSPDGRSMYFEAPLGQGAGVSGKGGGAREQTDTPEDAVTSFASLDLTGSQRVTTGQDVRTTQESRFSEFLPDVEFEILNTIVRQARFMIGNGQSSADIRLEPPSLGKLKLEIMTENSKITGKITVESHEVKQIIQSSLAELKEQLGQSGLKVQSFDVQVGHNSGADAWANRERAQNFSPTRRHDVFDARIATQGLKTVSDPVKRTRISQSDYIDLWI